MSESPLTFPTNNDNWPPACAEGRSNCQGPEGKQIYVPCRVVAFAPTHVRSMVVIGTEHEWPIRGALAPDDGFRIVDTRILILTTEQAITLRDELTRAISAS